MTLATGHYCVLISLLVDSAAVVVHDTVSLSQNSGFHYGVNEICILSGFYAAWKGISY
jgi:hypothetical protein